MQLMLYQSKKQKETGKESEANELLKMVYFTLQCMARGGIHDHVGGGFHRYSVDERWHGEFLQRANWTFMLPFRILFLFCAY